MNEGLKDVIKEKFAPGIKGIFSIKPLSEIIRERFFILALVMAGLLTAVLFFLTEKRLEYIDCITDIIIMIIPAILGLSLAGFAIVIGQVNQEALSRIADLDVGGIENKKTFSLYQKTNAVFSVTVLTQLIILIFAILIKIIKPLSLRVPVPGQLASMTNLAVLFTESGLFFYALFSIVDLVQNIFTTGQIVNFLFIKNKYIGQE
jgi:hypothetical protein